MTIPQAEVTNPPPAEVEESSESAAESPAVGEPASPTPQINDTVPQPPADSPPTDGSPVATPPIDIPPAVSNDVPAVFPDLSTPAGVGEVPTFPSPVDVENGAGDVSISAGGGESVSYARKKSGGGAGVIVFGAVLFIGFLGAGAWWLGYFEGETELVVNAVDDQTVQEEESLQYSISVENRDQHKRVRFRLVNGPTDSIVDKSGKFFWTPTEEQGPGDFDVKIEVVAGDQTKKWLSRSRLPKSISHPS